ncbi:MAG TPA: type II toxin-antitoxin system VapC family toxin [Rhizomicrobium sp.]
MVKVLFDTNILIDHLNGVAKASAEIALYRDRAVSAVGWIEVLVGASPATETPARAFLSEFVLVPLDEAVSERAVQLRRQHRLKLPDAISLASAQISGRLFVTRDERDFSHGNPGIRIPYRL